MSFRPWLNDLWEWLCWVGHFWRYLVTGSLLAAVYVVANAYFSKPLPWTGAVWVFIGFVLWASFLAWRDKNHEAQALDQRVDALESETGQLKRDLANRLSATGEALPPQPGRTYVEHSSEELVKMFEGVTTDEGQARVAKYIGKWMRVTGAFDDRRKYGDSYTIDFANPQWRMPNLAMSFTKEWSDKISVLKRGQKITVDGKIKSIEFHWMLLEECELV